MNPQLRSTKPTAEPGAAARALAARRQLALVVTSASAMLAGLAVGYALGTTHALQRTLAHGGHDGV